MISLSIIIGLIYYVFRRISKKKSQQSDIELQHKINQFKTENDNDSSKSSKRSSPFGKITTTKSGKQGAFSPRGTKKRPNQGLASTPDGVQTNIQATNSDDDSDGDNATPFTPLSGKNKPEPTFDAAV